MGGLARDPRFVAAALCAAMSIFASCSSEKPSIATSDYGRDDCNDASTAKTSNTTKKNSEAKQTKGKTSDDDEDLELQSGEEHALALADAAATYEGKIKGLIEKHCISCHYATSRTDQPPLGSAEFLLKDFKLPDGTSAKLYQRIVAVWGTTMPPGDPSNIPAADTLAIKEWQKANYPGLGLKDSGSGKDGSVDEGKKGEAKQPTGGGGKSSNEEEEDETEQEVKKTTTTVDPCRASNAKNTQNSSSGNTSKPVGSSKTSGSGKQSSAGQKSSSNEEEE